MNSRLRGRCEMCDVMEKAHAEADHPFSRRNRGARPKPAGTQMVRVTMRVTPEQRDKLQAIKGQAKLFRKFLDNLNADGSSCCGTVHLVECPNYNRAFLTV